MPVGETSVGETAVGETSVGGKLVGAGAVVGDGSAVGTVGEDVSDRHALKIRTGTISAARILF